MIERLSAVVNMHSFLGFIGVKQGLYDHLKLEIIVGNLEPGRKLNETVLASAFNISRAPLREAFRMLENEKLVTSIPRRGCYVTLLTVEHCNEVCQMREMMESFAIDLLERKNNPDLSELFRSIEKTAKMDLPSTDDAQERFAYLKSVLDFHIELVKATGNKSLSHFYEIIFTTLARYRSTYKPTVGLATRTRNEHERILALLSRGSYNEAKDVLRSHLQLAFEQITKAIVKMDRSKK